MFFLQVKEPQMININILSLTFINKQTAESERRPQKEKDRKQSIHLILRWQWWHETRLVKTLCLLEDPEVDEADSPSLCFWCSYFEAKAIGILRWGGIQAHHLILLEVSKSRMIRQSCWELRSLWVLHI